MGILSDEKALIEHVGSWEIGGRIALSIDRRPVPLSWSGAPTDTRRYKWIRMEVADEIEETRQAIEVDEDGEVGDSEDGKSLR